MKSRFHEVISLFDLSLTQLQAIQTAFFQEILLGISNQPCSLDTLLTFVGPPNHAVSGKWIAVDLGGTNLRALLVDLDSQLRSARVIKSIKKKLSSADISRTTDVLFDAIAQVVSELIHQESIKEINIGFTFSFPMKQLSINHCEVIRWTKEFSPSDGVGSDIGENLKKALNRVGIQNSHIGAIINDTTGTLLTCAFKNPNTDIGLILGTGTNMCIKMPCERVKKPLGQYSAPFIYINLESGNFNKALPQTRYDRMIDERSVNKTEQLEEKMVSGRYLGEIVSLILDTHTPLDTIAMAQIAQNHEDNMIQQVCRVVAKRSAQIAASMVAGAVSVIDPEFERDHIIATDGSLFEKYPHYPDYLNETIQSLLPTKANRIQFQLTSDGSGIGAAIAAALG